MLVGTISVEVSERVAALLERKGITHNVLNARTGQEGQEAQIIKDAGAKGAVTIATNMAGRGVDIKLGEGVDRPRRPLRDRHRAPRVAPHRQPVARPLRPPGRPRRDALLPLGRGSARAPVRRRPHLHDPRQARPGRGQPIEHKMLTKRIEGAQKRVEEMHFDMRKQVLKYDDVLNKQREVIYAERRGVLEGDDLSEEILEWIDEVVEDVVIAHAESNFPEEWDLDGLLHRPPPGLPASRSTRTASARVAELEREELITRCIADAHLAYERKEKELAETPGLDPDIMRQLERFFLLQVIDAHWREHLDSMDYLREGIHLRSMAQKDPLVEYRVEGHAMFEEMMAGVREEVVSMLFHVEVTAQDAELERPDSGQLIYDDGGSDAGASYAGSGSSTSTFTPAGSGGSSSSTVRAPSGNGAARRSAATIPARAARAASTSAATGRPRRCRSGTQSELARAAAEELRARLAWVRDYL